MKGSSIAIFGFLTLGVAIAAFVWVQYNAIGGIRTKANFADDFAFMRLGQEAAKGNAYLEGGLRNAGIDAMRDVLAAGGSCDGEISLWQCGETQVPERSEILHCAGMKAEDIFGQCAANIGKVSENALLSVSGSEDIIMREGEDGIKILAPGAYIEATDGESYIRGSMDGISARIDDESFMQDYEALRAWTEDGVVEEMVAQTLENEGILPQELTSETCGCGSVSCQKAEDVIDDVFPCWEDRIDDAVRGAVEKAVEVLESDGKYFGGAASCSVEVMCVSKIKPTARNAIRQYRDSGICCGDECKGCEKDPEADVTERICRGESKESVCEAPDCNYRAENHDSIEKNDNDYYEYEGGTLSGGDYESGDGDYDECEMCCVLEFDLEYSTDVMFTVSCEDERGSAPVVIQAEFVVES